MLRLQRPPYSLLKAGARRWHSSSSSPPSPTPQAKEQENSNNNTTETNEASAVGQVAHTQSTSTSTSTTTAASVKPAKRSKSGAALKRPISLKPHSSTVSNPLTYFVNPPTVNSTQHLDMAVLRTDLFYGGFRPVLTPLRRPVTKAKKTPTIPLSWNVSACKLESFDDFSKIPQFVVDKLVPFNSPQDPGNEIRLGAKSRKEQKELERLTKDVYEFIKHFRR